MADLASGVAAGEISRKEGLRRASLYANRIRGTANEAFREASEDLGLKLYWDLGPGDHCVECPRYAAMSPWEPDELPTTPGEGETPCGSNCTCGIRREDGKEGFTRTPSVSKVAAGMGDAETATEEPPETTDSPTLPKLFDGGRYVDLPNGSTLDDARSAFQRVNREVLSVAAADGTLDFAPLVGEKDEVSIDPFRSRLKDRIVTHNHPSGTMLSVFDLEAAIDADMARIEAVLPNGTIIAWDRPEAGWPDADEARKAYVTAFKRALKGKAAGLQDRLRRQVDRALGDEKTFGKKTLTVKISGVESK